VHIQYKTHSSWGINKTKRQWGLGLGESDNRKTNYTERNNWGKDNIGNAQHFMAVTFKKMLMINGIGQNVLFWF
jgi:hypothetical protein